MNSFNLSNFILLILLVSIHCQLPPDFAGHFVKHNSALMISSESNNTLDIDIGTKAKLGATYFSITMRDTIHLLFWRNSSFNLQYSRLVVDEKTFQLVESPNIPVVVDYTFGGPIFDIMGEFQNISIILNISDVVGRSTNFTCTLAWIPLNSVNFQSGIRYTKFWSSNLTVESNELTPGYLYLANHVSLRWEMAHPAFFAIAVGWYLFLFIPLIIFRNHQPLASRGIYPMFSNLIVFLMVVGSVRNWLSIEWRYRTGCYFYSLWSDVIVISIGIVGSLAYMRYSLIQYLNNRKNVIVKSRSIGIVEPRKFPIKVIEFMLTWYAQISFVLPVLFWTFSVFALSLLLPGNQNFGNCVVRSNFFIGMLGLWFVVNLINVPFAIFAEWDAIKTCSWRILLSDPFYFKWEIYILYTLGFMYAMVIQGVVGQNQNVFGAIKPGQWWRIVLWSSQFYLISIIQTVLPLFITIFRFFRQKCHRGAKISLLKELLKDDEGMSLLFKQAQRELSVENVACLQDILKFEQLDGIEEKWEFAMRIYTLYCDGSKSPLQLNVTNSTCNNLKHILDKNYLEVPFDVFEELKRGLMENLTDTYSRLSSTTAFREWARTREFRQKWDLHKSSDLPVYGDYNLSDCLLENDYLQQ